MVDKYLERMEELGAPRPKKVEPKPVPYEMDVIGIVGNAVVQSALIETKNYLNNAANEYKESVERIAKYATSGEDFIKKVDTISPQYKLQAMFSPTIRSIQGKISEIAEDIDFNITRQTQNIESNLLLSDLTDLYNKRENFGAWNADAEQSVEALRSKYGNLIPGFREKYDSIKKTIKYKYDSGEYNAAVDRLTKNATTQLALTNDVTFENFKQVAVDLEKNIKNNTEMWQPYISRFYANAVENSKDMQEGLKIIEDGVKNHYLTESDSVKLKSIVVNHEMNRIKLGRTLALGLHKHVQDQLDVGLAVPDDMLVDRAQAVTNEFLKEHDAAHMNIKDLEALGKKTKKIPLTTKIINKLKNDFANDFDNAVKKRNPGMEVPKIIQPIIASRDILDEDGEIDYVKGDVINMPEVLDSIAKKLAVFNVVAMMYGSDVITHPWSIEEINTYSTIRSKFTEQQQSIYDRSIIDTIRNNTNTQDNDPYYMLSKITADNDMADFFRYIDNATDGETVSLFTVNKHSFLQFKNRMPEKFQARKSFVSKQMNQIKSTDGIRILPNTIDKRLRDFIEKNTIGSTAFARDEDVNISEMYNFHTRPMNWFSQKAMKLSKGVSSLFDFGDKNLFAEYEDSLLPSSARTPFVTMGPEDAKKYRKALAETPVYVPPSLGGKTTVKKLLDQMEHFAVINYKGSLKEGILVEIDMTGDTKPVLDVNEKPIIISIG